MQNKFISMSCLEDSRWIQNLADSFKEFKENQDMRKDYLAMITHQFVEKINLSEGTRYLSDYVCNFRNIYENLGYVTPFSDLKDLKLVDIEKKTIQALFFINYEDKLVKDLRNMFYQITDDNINPDNISEELLDVIDCISDYNNKIGKLEKSIYYENCKIKDYLKGLIPINIVKASKIASNLSYSLQQYFYETSFENYLTHYETDFSIMFITRIKEIVSSLIFNTEYELLWKPWFRKIEDIVYIWENKCPNFDELSDLLGELRDLIPYNSTYIKFISQGRIYIIFQED